MGSNKDRASYTCFSAVLIAFLAFHTVSVVIDINPLSGNLTSGSKTGVLSVITLVLLIASTAALLFFNRNRECRTSRFKSRKLGVCSIAFAFAIVLESFSKFFILKSNLANAVKDGADGEIQGGELILKIQIAVIIISALAAVYLFAMGFMMVDKKSETFPPDILCAAVPLWCAVRIAANYVEFTNTVALSERLYDIPQMCLSALMLISFARLFCDIPKGKIGAKLSGYSLAVAAVSISLVLSRIIASVGLGISVVTAGWQDAFLQIVMSAFALTLYVELGKTSSETVVEQKTEPTDPAELQTEFTPKPFNTVSDVMPMQSTTPTVPMVQAVDQPKQQNNFDRLN